MHAGKMMAAIKQDIGSQALNSSFLAKISSTAVVVLAFVVVKPLIQDITTFKKYERTCKNSELNVVVDMRALPKSDAKLG